MTELRRRSQPSAPWSHIRDLLAEYGFSPPSELPSAFRRLTTKDLDGFLDQYRGLYLDKDGNVLIGQTSPGVAVWPDHITTADWIEKLRAWALWVDRVYVSDPVLAVTGPSDRDARFTLGERTPLNVKVQRAVEQLLRMFPFVETGYANLTGVPLFREAPAVPPLTLDPASDQFDPQLREIALRRLRVAPGRKPQGKGVVSFIDSDLVPVLGETRSSDIILFAFEEDADVHIADGFFWATIANVSDDGQISGRIPMSGEPIPKEAFEPWLNQSVVKVLRRRFQELAQEVAWSTALDAHVVTASMTNAELLTARGVPGRSARLEKLEDLRLPGLLDVPIATLAKVRQDLESVRAFRTVLRSLLSSVQGERGTPEYEDGIRDARRELEEERMPAMREEIRSRRSRALRNAILTPLVAGAGTLLAGWEAGAVAAAVSLPLSAFQIRDYFQDSGRHPLAIYTKLEKAASKKRQA